MPKPTGPTNPEVWKLIAELTKKSKSEKNNLWSRVADELRRPARNQVSVNLSKINRYTVDDDTVLVPGKVLSSGELNHKVCVAALSFSKEATNKAKKTGGECITIQELMKRNPSGTNVKIIG
ncbi:MAG: 50S ribosomal protein L18e [Candidatus Freyarchaeum deiterrae]